MINIAICDDEHIEITYLTKLVKEWAVIRGETVRIKDYESAESFLFSYEDNTSADILLLDIEMKAMDGVELARLIRKDNDLIQIIFVTGYADFIADGYDVSALHYLMKPVNEEKFFEVLDKAVLRLQKSSRMILFPKTGGGIKIKADDIVYAEVISHKVVLYHTNGSEAFQMRISDMEKLLGDGFFKCHRSFIVSMKYVKRVTKSAILLENGKEIPLSRSNYDAANQAFIGYH